ncbi:hypothetical protein EDC01DRAFT_463000 [Geopyxis carbonaria]|nr:hypothetical protein EDC01DRAFT_463000 [Geopyxis carbonaria]
MQTETKLTPESTNSRNAANHAKEKAEILRQKGIQNKRILIHDVNWSAGLELYHTSANLVHVVSLVSRALCVAATPPPATRISLDFVHRPFQSPPTSQRPLTPPRFPRFWVWNLDAFLMRRHMRGHTSLIHPRTMLRRGAPGAAVHRRPRSHRTLNKPADAVLTPPQYPVGQLQRKLPSHSVRARAHLRVPHQRLMINPDKPLDRRNQRVRDTIKHTPVAKRQYIVLGRRQAQHRALDDALLVAHERRQLLRQLAVDAVPRRVRARRAAQEREAAVPAQRDRARRHRDRRRVAQVHQRLLEPLGQALPRRHGGDLEEVRAARAERDVRHFVLVGPPRVEEELEPAGEVAGYCGAALACSGPAGGQGNADGSMARFNYACGVWAMWDRTYQCTPSGSASQYTGSKTHHPRPAPAPAPPARGCAVYAPGPRASHSCASCQQAITRASLHLAHRRSNRVVLGYHTIPWPRHSR